MKHWPWYSLWQYVSRHHLLLLCSPSMLKIYCCSAFSFLIFLVIFKDLVYHMVSMFSLWRSGLIFGGWFLLLTWSLLLGNIITISLLQCIISIVIIIFIIIIVLKHIRVIRSISRILLNIFYLLYKIKLVFLS